jgi:hypothetical protein
MKRMRIMGLCLVVAVAISAIAAVSASALPEIGRCVAKVEIKSKYTDSNCNVKAVKGNGKFEFVKGAGAVNEGFTSTGESEGILETEGGTKVICHVQSATGKYDEDFSTTTPPVGSIKEVEGVVAKFNECELPVIKGACNSTGKASGEIVTNTLQGPLGYINKAKKEVGQELTPATKKAAFAEFSCGGGAVKIVVKEGPKLGHNCIIAPVVKVNEMSLTATQTYSGSAGKQNPQNFEGKTVCNLESNASGGPFERATQALITKVTNEQPLEIKA